MKRLIASFAVLGLIASPAIATTKVDSGQTQTSPKAKPHKNSKKAAKENKAAANTSKASN